MGRNPCCPKGGLHKGPWTLKEDTLLINYIQQHGEGHWRALPKQAGLLRCGKSCRLRWMNYLRPDIKRGNITPDEDDLIIKLHSLLGNRWSLIAGRLPGRTDNEIKNYWNSHLSKRLSITSLENAGHENKEKKIMTVLNTHDNGEASNTNIHLPKHGRVSTFCDDLSSDDMVKNAFPLFLDDDVEGRSNVGDENQNSKGRIEMEENQNHVNNGCEILCEGFSNSPSNGEMMSEFEYDYYQKLINFKGEDYIQLESFIDYF